LKLDDAPSRGGRHKGSIERVVLSLRAKIGAVLDSGDVKGPSRLKLEEVVDSLLMLELDLSKSRLTASTSLDRLRLQTICASDRSASREEDAHHVALARVFSERNDSAAEWNMSTSKKATTTRLRPRFSTEELDDLRKVVLQDDVARAVLEDVGKMCFDTFKFTSVPEVARRPITVLFSFLESKGHLLKDLLEGGQITETKLLRGRMSSFMSLIDGNYKNVPYHTQIHGADVMMTIDWMFRSTFVHEHMTTLDHLMSLVAAAIHDVGHPGTNNFFQINTMSDAAITYNDKSVLENMHVSTAFDLMRQDQDCNWFELLEAGNQRTYIRRGLVHMVLATDMAKHAKHVDQLRSFVEEMEEQMEVSHETEEQLKMHALEKKTFLLETLLHAADISNPTKPPHLMLRWTERILEEMWCQGDQEVSLGLPISPLCNRATDSLIVPRGQVGFITFVVQPLFKPLASLIEEIQEATDQLERNKDFWQQKDKEGAMMSDLIGRP